MSRVPRDDMSPELRRFLDDLDRRGAIEFATAAQAIARTSNTVATTPLSLALFGLFKSGTYTGDGSTNLAITGVGFRPKFLAIIQGGADGGGSNIFITTDLLVDDDAQGLAYSIATNTLLDNRILSLDADGFSVSDDSGDSNPNSSGTVYYYIALG